MSKIIKLQKIIKREMDYIKHKYGVEKLVRATTLGVSKRVLMEMNMFKGKVSKDLLKY